MCVKDRLRRNAKMRKDFADGMIAYVKDLAEVLGARRTILPSLACAAEEKLLTELILHNREDLKGMLYVVNMLAYPDMFLNPIRVMGVKANYYDDIQKKRCQEIIMKLRFLAPFPKPISFRGLGCYFSGSGIDGALKVPLYEEEMKYFKKLIQNNAHLILQFSKEGGILNASGL